jgi:viroplasmin and RNaseH domain-containing protein
VQIDGYSSATFKKFTNETDAWAFVLSGNSNSSKPKTTRKRTLQVSEIVLSQQGGETEDHESETEETP